MSTSPDRKPAADLKDGIILASSDEIEVYRIFAEQIKKEDDLINHRMNWGVAVNGGFVAIVGAFLSKNGPNVGVLDFVFCFLFACAAAFISISTILAIQAANDQMHVIKGTYKKIWIDYFKARGLPPPAWIVERAETPAELKRWWWPQHILIYIVVSWVLLVLAVAARVLASLPAS